MIKILFLINTLGGGGAERVLVNLVNNMDKTKFDITVETMFADGVNAELLSNEITLISKNKYKIKGLSNIIKYIPAKLLYKYYINDNNYDIIVAYMHGAPTKVISGCGSNQTKRITWLHYGNPLEGSFFNYWFSKTKAKKAYLSMDALVGVSNSVSYSFNKYFNLDNLVVTLYNTNDTKKIVEMSKDNNCIKINKKFTTICTSGRLRKQKGFDRLIQAASCLHNEGYRFLLFILGDGPEKDSLIHLIEKKKADEYIKMMGFCDNPYNIMVQSDFYVSSSREEGLATVLTEALTLGLPVVSTDVSGAREVLGENNEFGLVVENSESGIYQGIKLFLEEKGLRDKYSSKAKLRSEVFNTKNTVNKTEKFFESLIIK